MANDTLKDDASRAYVKGFESLRSLGQLSRLPTDLAYEMFDTVAQGTPETAAQMEDMYDRARVDALSETAAALAAPRQIERQRVRLERMSARTGMPVASILRVRAGGHDREFVEARAALYRM